MAWRRGWGVVPGGIGWLFAAGAPVDGIAGTGVGVATKGFMYIDSATGFQYVNLGTAASPEWHGVILA